MATATTAKTSNQKAVQAASTATQHSATLPGFSFPNPGCAAQCLGDLFNYSNCYNSCVNPASIVSVAGSGSTSSVTPITGSSNPIVNPVTGQTITSGTGVQGTQPANQTYPSSAATGTNALANVNWQDIGIRAGLVLGGSILVIVGIVKIFSGQPVTVPGQLARRRPTPTPPPVMQSRSFVETRPVSNPPPNPTVRTTPNVTAAAAGAP